MIDLHTHSSVSDGSDAPERIPELAAEVGCRAVALTDHDRLDGLRAARASAEAAGVELVPGCELSCRAPNPSAMHLLVYFVEDGEGPLQDELVRLQRIRDDRNARMVDRLHGDLGLPITLDEVVAEAGGMGVGRPHIAAVLARNGAVSSIQEAFDRYVGEGTPGYVERERLEPAEAISLARASGGVCVLAHPLSLRLEPPAIERAVGELAALGLAGLEAVYGRYREDERAALVALAGRLGLAATGGSDYHGSYKPDLRVGVGRGDLDVPDDALDALLDRRP